MTTVVNVNEGKRIDKFYRNNLQVVLMINAQELAQDLAQDQSTVRARNVKNFLHILRSQNVMLNKPRDHDENGHEQRSADRDLKCDPILKNKMMKSVNLNILLLQNILFVLLFCFHLFNLFPAKSVEMRDLFTFLLRVTLKRLQLIRLRF